MEKYLIFIFVVVVIVVLILVGIALNKKHQKKSQYVKSSLPGCPSSMNIYYSQVDMCQPSYTNGTPNPNFNPNLCQLINSIGVYKSWPEDLKNCTVGALQGAGPVDICRQICGL